MWKASRLDAFSAYPYPTRIPAVHLAAQPANRRSVQHGPLVLVSEPRKFPAPTIDRDRTVSRRSEPSSRATLMGEQPNPLGPSPAPGWTSRHRGAKPLRRYELLGGDQPVIPGVPFYPLSDGPSMRNRRITMLQFPACAACRPPSQAPFCHYTLRPVTNRPEGTFEEPPLRFWRRPPQSNYPPNAVLGFTKLVPDGQRAVFQQRLHGHWRARFDATGLSYTSQPGYKR